MANRIPRFNPQSAKKSIPGITGRRIPGVRGKMPHRTGGHMTRVPWQEGFANQRGSSIFREYHRQQIRDSRGQFVGGWGVAWQGLALVAEEVVNLVQNTEDSLEDMAEKLARDMLEYAKQNAPWEDYPGNPPRPGRETQHARQNLQAQVIKEPNGNIVIFLGHGKDVWYGIWLEVRWGGRYAIVLPTVHKFMPEIGNRLRVQT